MRWYDPLLYPFSLVYDGITKYRNGMFDDGRKKSTGFLIPTVVVGNLNLGGSGKTPMVEFLIESFQNKYRLATLSRGYGRKTKGFILANESSSPPQLGDEPFQIYSKYGDKVVVSVGEERIMAIPQIIYHAPETEVILLDDAFQHRYVKADFNILLTTFQKPFFKDKVLPLGTLRENVNGAIRADVIIVTKCPNDVSKSKLEEIENQIKVIADKPVIFAKIKYGEPIALYGNEDVGNGKVILVSGIADDRLLQEEVKKRYKLVETITFGDHHRYNLTDIQKVLELVKTHEGAVILTTEKDAVKLKDLAFHEYLKEIPIFALPIKFDLADKDRQYLLGRITEVIKDKAYLREI